MESHSAVVADAPRPALDEGRLPPVAAWCLLAAGILATIYAWNFRQPLTTADFTLFYQSAAGSPSQMYARPPGPPRANMNPPQFQLLLRPLTMLPLPLASEVFVALSVACLCGCLWWIARKGEDRWDVADLGAVLAWTPMATVLNLNQVTWALWPLLVATWWCWRRERWTAGAIAYGLAFSVKPFLGVFLLWLLVTKRWKAAAVSIAAAGLGWAAGLAYYGPTVFRAWVVALRDVQWWRAGMNASLQSLFARLLMPLDPRANTLPRSAAVLALVGQVLVIIVTLVRTRTRTIDRSWTSIVAASLLASPLGWVYYAWWLLPGPRPSRLLIQSPMLWLPFIFLAPNTGSRFVAATLDSVYFWGVLAVWCHSLRD